MRPTLVTGFPPWIDFPVNPAEQVAKALDGTTIAGSAVVGRVVPGTFFGSIAAARAAIAEVEPDLVIMLGEYGGRSMITVERSAQNLNDSSRYGIADDEGRVMQGEPTAPEGPAAYYATVPVRAMVRAMRQAGIPADISDAPGTNVCNHLMYGVLHHLAVEGLAIRAGWIHLPHLPSTAALEANLGRPSMSVETAAEGVRVGIKAARTHTEDLDAPVRSLFQI